MYHVGKCFAIKGSGKSQVNGTIWISKACLHEWDVSASNNCNSFGPWLNKARKHVLTVKDTKPLTSVGAHMSLKVGMCESALMNLVLKMLKAAQRDFCQKKQTKKEPFKCDVCKGHK